MWWLKKNKQKTRKENERFWLNRDRNQKFYHSTKWLRLRLHKLLQDPCCEYCLKKNIIEPAFEVHHDKNINTEEGWMKRLNLEFLVSLCKVCHSRTTVDEQRQRRDERIKNNMDFLNDF